MPDGGLRVTDFKTGKVTALTNPLSDGQRLQLPLYARAADHDRAILTGSDDGEWPPATARYLEVRDADVKEHKMPLDDALVAGSRNTSRGGWPRSPPASSRRNRTRPTVAV
jgi:hypothetical protein